MESVDGTRHIVLTREIALYNMRRLPTASQQPGRKYDDVYLPPVYHWRPIAGNCAKGCARADQQPNIHNAADDDHAAQTSLKIEYPGKTTKPHAPPLILGLVSNSFEFNLATARRSTWPRWLSDRFRTSLPKQAIA